MSNSLITCLIIWLLMLLAWLEPFFSNTGMLPDLGNYFSDYNVMITERNDGQNCKNKTEIDSNKLDSSFNVCSKSIPALILPDDLTVPSTLTVTSNIMSPWPEANCPSLVHAGIQLQGCNSSLSAFENVETFNWRGTVFLVPNTWNQLWSWHTIVNTC